MNLLALDTATEHCSVALLCGDQAFERGVVTPRGHADLILPMVQEVMQEAGLQFADLNALAFGRGPGGFTGVRIAVSVTQGIAYAHDLPVVPVSNLAAVAQRAASEAAANIDSVLVCMDARMGEVYWAVFRIEQGLAVPATTERVSPPEGVQWSESLSLCVGTGFGAYPALRDRFVTTPQLPQLLPRAADIARLAKVEVHAGRTVTAAEAQPVYVRDEVAHRRSEHNRS